VKQWLQARTDDTTRPEFLLAAQPFPALSTVGQVMCRICPQRPATSRSLGLCLRHRKRWTHAQSQNSALALERWCAGEDTYPGFGDCLVTGCSDLAASPLGLCRWHELSYDDHSRPGGARLPASWIRWGEAADRPVEVSYRGAGGQAEFLRWCATAPTQSTHGQLDLRGLRPLVTEELRWGVFRHTEGDRSRWALPTVQGLVNRCREQKIDSLVDLSLGDCPPRVKLIATEMLHELRLVYFAPTGATGNGTPCPRWRPTARTAASPPSPRSFAPPSSPTFGRCCARRCIAAGPMRSVWTAGSSSWLPHRPTRKSAPAARSRTTWP